MDKDTKARHENGLTEREAQVVKLSARGFTNREWLSRIGGLASAWTRHTLFVEARSSFARDADFNDSLSHLPIQFLLEPSHDDDTHSG